VTETAVVPVVEDRNAEIAAQVVVKGDLAKLTEVERMTYYVALCRSLGLNPLSRPFEFITLNNKLTLYAKRDATDQLRKLYRVSITNLTTAQVGDILAVTAYGRTPDGREDSGLGAVSIRGLAGESLANAMMKAETKAKRRLTLSLVGLGFPSEDEIEDMPEPEAAAPKVTLAERVAAKAAAITPAVQEKAEEPIVEGEFTAAEITEALAEPGDGGCGFRLGLAKGGEIVPCTFAPDHDGDHSWKDRAMSEGGRVIRPEAAS
jgi:hypothetical protein